MQDKVEQQHLKRLVLDYEQREEAEEWKGAWRNLGLRGALVLPMHCGTDTLVVYAALEQRSRLGGGIKIRYVG